MFALIDQSAVRGSCGAEHDSCDSLSDQGKIPATAAAPHRQEGVLEKNFEWKVVRWKAFGRLCIIHIRFLQSAAAVLAWRRYCPSGVIDALQRTSDSVPRSLPLKWCLHLSSMLPRYLYVFASFMDVLSLWLDSVDLSPGIVRGPKVAF